MAKKKKQSVDEGTLADYTALFGPGAAAARAALGTLAKAWAKKHSAVQAKSLYTAECPEDVVACTEAAMNSTIETLAHLIAAKTVLTCSGGSANGEQVATVPEHEPAA